MKNESETCKSCIYWDNQEKKQINNLFWGFCRFYPPTADAMGDGVWPATIEIDWCGMWTPEIPDE